LEHIFQNIQKSNFLKIPPVETEQLHADRKMDRYDEANSRFFANFASTPNTQWNARNTQWISEPQTV